MAGGTTAGDPKKAISKAFTGVVRSSALDVDPKAFFMMVIAHFDVLHRDGRLELGPLWDAMAAKHPPDLLYGVFLMFRLKAMDLGFRVVLPDAVDRLTEDQMRLAMRPYTGLMIPDEPTPFIPLSTADLRPFIPDELRRRVLQIVSSAIRTSPVGAKVDAAQLSFHIDSGFEALFDGQSFDFSQIFAELRLAYPLKDAEIFQAVARAKAELQQMSIGVQEPPLSLSDQEKQSIVQEIQRAEERAAQERASPISPKPAETKPAGPVEKPAPEVSSKTKLEEYGLTSVNEKKKGLPIRAIALGVVVLVLGFGAFLTRSNRSLAHEHYDAYMPVTSAELYEGTFQCTIDDSRWFALTPEQRAERLAKFEAALREEGHVQNMQCRDSQKRLVITASGNGKIAGAAFFMRGDASGTIPKVESVADTKDP